MTEEIKTYCRFRCAPETSDIRIRDNEVMIFDRKFVTDGFLDDQQHVYDVIGKPMVEDVLNGYHATVFAYGQSGSGKTYTMCGEEAALGLVPRIAEAFISHPRSRVSVCFLQIYNNQLSDMITHARIAKISVGEKPPGDDITIDDFESFWELYQQAARERQVQSTSLNDVSSRSHMIVRFTVEMTHKDGKTRACFHCIDLCGSERLKDSHAEGAVKRETEFINSDLSALGTYVDRVFAAQQDPEFFKKHTMVTGMRDSALNKIVGRHIGGKFKTRFVITLMPSAIKESESSLCFAERVRKVTTKPKKNFTGDSLQRKYDLLLEEVKRLRAKLAEYERELRKLGKSDSYFLSVQTLVEEFTPTSTVTSVSSAMSSNGTLKPKDLQLVLTRRKSRPSIAGAFLSNVRIEEINDEKQRDEFEEEEQDTADPVRVKGANEEGKLQREYGIQCMPELEEEEEEKEKEEDKAEAKCEQDEPELRSTMFDVDAYATRALAENALNAVGSCTHVFKELKGKDDLIEKLKQEIVQLKLRIK